MKALLRKDFYALRSTLLWYTLVIVIFNVSFNAGGVLIALLYAALLPSSAFAYDDRSRWGELAAMLPYSEWDIVLSRYVLGWLSVAGFGAATALARWMVSVFSLKTRSSDATLPVVILMASISIIFLDLCLPVYFRFDAEKSRVVRTIMIMLVCGVAGSAGAVITIEAVSGVLPALYRPRLLLLLAAAVILTAVSIPLSRRAYRVRNGRR